MDARADAAVGLLRLAHDEDLSNVGVGQDRSIAELARPVAEVVDYRGQIAFDPSKPDGTPRKLLDVSRLKGMGWAPKSTLKQGIERSYADFLEGKVRM